MNKPKQPPTKPPTMLQQAYRLWKLKAESSACLLALVTISERAERLNSQLAVARSDALRGKLEVGLAQLVKQERLIGCQHREKEELILHLMGDQS